MFNNGHRRLAATMVITAAIVVATTAASQDNSAGKGKANPIPTSGPPAESEHVRGPNGLEGWKLESPLPDRPDDTFPFTLIVARNGVIIRRIAGEPFVWEWKFCPDGKQIAYETGPLHFGLQCNLEDISTGRMIWSEDCFHGLPEHAPACVKDLEKAY